MAADELTDWARGDPLAAAHLQQPISVLRKMLGKPDGQVARQRLSQGGFTFVVTLGKIVSTGPGGAANFTGEQYWVKPQYVTNQQFQNESVLLGDITPSPEYMAGSTLAADSNIKAVTNLSELSHGTHHLELGQYVWFFGLTDGQDDPVEHFYMSEAAPSGGGAAHVVCKITANHTGGGKYKGFIVNGETSTATTSSNLSAADLGGVGTAEVMIQNVLEVGTSGHWIDTALAQVFFLCVPTGAFTMSGTNSVQIVNAMALQTPACA